MKVDREQLLSILSMARPALARKEIIQQAVHFVFTGDTVATYNDQLCIFVPYKFDTPFSVQGEEFYKALDSIKEKEIEIIVSEKEVKIKAKKTKAGLSSIIGEDGKIENKIENLKNRVSGKKFWKALPTNFIQGVFLCMFSTSKDMTTGVRCCVAIKDDKIFSTDNTRVSRYLLNGKVEELLIPVKDAEELVKYNVTQYGISEGWAHFKTDDGVIFNCKMMKGNYPYEVLDRWFKEPVNAMTLPDELQEVLKASAVFAEGDVDVSKMVEITIEKDKIICKSEKERGWMIKETEIEEYKGDTLKFYVNPIFLSQVLTKASSLVLLRRKIDPTVEFPDKAVLFNENFSHIIALPE